VAAGDNRSGLEQANFGLSESRTFASGCAPSVPELFHPNRAKTGGLKLNGPTSTCSV
jgi:hypothetical protein